jgi:hypothetical protein
MSHDAIAVRLPSACSCGRLTGKIVDAHAVCDGCGQKRFPVSELTLRTLARISQMFGAPAEPIVFRSSDAKARLEQHDLLLKNKYARDGRSFHQVIGDIIDGVGNPPSDSDGIEAVDDTEL